MICCLFVVREGWGVVKGVVNVSLKAAGSYITIVRNKRPAIVTGPRNTEAAPSIITFAGANRELMNRITGHRTVAGRSGAVVSVGERVKDSCEIGVSSGSCAPRRVSTVVLRGLGSSTRDCLNRGIARTIVAIPTCFDSTRHRTAGSTNEVTNLRIGEVVGRPATTTLTCNLSGSASRGVVMCSLNNNAFSMSVLRVNSNMFRILTAGKGGHLNNSSFSRGLVSCLTRRFGGRGNVSLEASGVTRRELGRTTRGTGVRLSNILDAGMGLPFVATSTANPGRLSVAVAERGFGRLATSLISGAVRPAGGTVSSTNVDMGRVSGILLMNNSSEVPTITRTISGFVKGSTRGNVGPSRYITLNTYVRNNILANRIRSLILLSMAPLSLNVRAVNNMFAGVVREGAAVPAGGDRMFSATTSDRADIRIRILRNRHRVTTCGGALNEFDLGGVPPTPHNIPRVRIAFSVSTGNVIRMATGSLKANGSRSIAVASDAGLSSRSVRGTIGRTRRFTTRSGGGGRGISIGGATSGLICRARGALARLKSGVSRRRGDKVRARISGLGRLVGASSFSIRTIGARDRTISRGFCTMSRGLCRRTTTRRRTRGTSTGNNTGSSGIISTSCGMISRSGWVN